MEIIQTVEFWSLVANLGLGIALIIAGAKAKGSMLIIDTIKDAIKEYANEPEKPNKEVINKVNKALSDKNKI